MARARRRKSKRPETMQRNAVISSFTPSIRLRIRGQNDPEPEIEGRPVLELRGTLVEPIRDVQNVVFQAVVRFRPGSPVRHGERACGLGSTSFGILSVRISRCEARQPERFRNSPGTRT